MTGPAVALACLGLALALGGPARRRPKRHAATEAALTGPGAPARRLPLAPERMAAAALAVAIMMVVGGLAGAVAGVLAFLGADRLVRRLEPREARRRREHRAAELPLVLDLLSVCLRAGMPLVAALETIAAALPGPLSHDLAVVAGLQRLGSSAASAWTHHADDPDLGAVARAVSRSAESGSRLAAAFERLATDRRSALAAAGEAQARRAGVTAMAPLGLCFLPAFICLGIVPIVLSLAAEVLR